MAAGVTPPSIYESQLGIFSGDRFAGPAQQGCGELATLTSSATQRELAETYGVDRTTIRSICATAKQGALDALAAAVPRRRGRSAEQIELEEARVEIEWLKATICEQAVSLHLEKGKRRLGLNAGLVPARVDGPVKQGLLDLVEHAQAHGFSGRWACRALGLDHARTLSWQAKARSGSDLADAPPGPLAGQALHALLDWEAEAVVALAQDWGTVDRSHRKLAHRGSRLGTVFVAESTVLRVLTAAGEHLPGLPRVGGKRAKTPWPDWVELIPGQIFIYDFTHFRGLRGWCAIAVIDVISRYWLSTVLAPEETWVQVQNAFIAALEADGKGWLLEDDTLAQDLASGHLPENDDRLPALLAVSDNGPQMRASKTAEFMAIARIAQHFGRPGTPNDQAWIESFFGHLKGEHPYLDALTNAETLRSELDIRRQHYNTVRLHESIGYVTPEDEHHGRGPAIRKKRRDGLTSARAHRIATRRRVRKTETEPPSEDEDI